MAPVFVPSVGLPLPVTSEPVEPSKAFNLDAPVFKPKKAGASVPGAPALSGFYPQSLTPLMNTEQAPAFLMSLPVFQPQPQPAPPVFTSGSVDPMNGYKNPFLPKQQPQTAGV